MRFLACLLLSTPLWAQTHIIDTLRYRFTDPSTNSNLASCTMYISDNTPSSDANDTYVPATLTYSVINGVVNLALQPNDTGIPAGTSYSVQYACESDQPLPPEIWYVPSGGPYTIRAVRVATLPGPGLLFNPSQLAGGGAIPGQYLEWSGTSWVAQVPDVGGDLSGSAETATVSGIQGHPVSVAAPIDGQMLRWSALAGQWQPVQVRYTTTFSGLTSVLISGATHQLATQNLSVTCYDSATPRNIVEPDSWTVNPTTYDVTINFTMAQTGTCTIR